MNVVHIFVHILLKVVIILANFSHVLELEGALYNIPLSVQDMDLLRDNREWSGVRLRNSGECAVDFLIFLEGNPLLKVEVWSGTSNIVQGLRVDVKFVDFEHVTDRELFEFEFLVVD